MGFPRHTFAYAVAARMRRGRRVEWRRVGRRGRRWREEGEAAEAGEEGGEGAGEAWWHFGGRVARCGPLGAQHRDVGVGVRV